MSRPDDLQPAAPLATAMDTAREAGAPGDHLAPMPLTREEQALADRLRAKVSVDRAAGAGEPAAQDSPAVVGAVEDDSVLPVAPAEPESGADPLTPEFGEPTDG
ncbi:hypothetical protein [Nakamurella leprariae]|uniref:Uncharacterized protein n=1 Tax=Nakamurella leprariae TaxID=2803911 RepID=A0A938YGS6_9ACTN|nr:hypothetical protein [Nakamurella leprariae]MBM9469624.1 hypothetical protein [Nakamurella leprariae]